MSLTPNQRLALIDCVNGLVQVDFERLVFALAAPRSVIPSGSSAQGNRASALFEWVEGSTGCGIDDFLDVLRRIATLPPELAPSPPPSPTPSVVPAISTGNLFADAQTNTIHLLNGVTLDMVYIPGGRFFMGSPENEDGRRKDEGLQHKVKVPGFYMGKYPVTQEQWAAVALMDNVDIHLSPNPSRFKGAKRPVEQVSWHDATEFCKRLSNFTGHSYRLPGEAEWEYACRANTLTRYAFGDELKKNQANCNHHVGSTTPVGQYSPNAFGLYDMHGNVWDWCADHWHDNYTGAPADATIWLSSDEKALRVLRGGSWFNVPEACRSATRDQHNPAISRSRIGLRVCTDARTFPIKTYPVSLSDIEKFDLRL